MSDIKFPDKGCSGYKNEGKDKCPMYMRCMRTKINDVSKSLGKGSFDEAPFSKGKDFECDYISTDIHKIWNLSESEVTKLYKEYFGLVKEEIQPIVDLVNEDGFFEYNICEKLKMYNDEETGYGYYPTDGTHTTSQTYFAKCTEENKDKRLCIAIRIDMFPTFFDQIDLSKSNGIILEYIKICFEDRRKSWTRNFSYITPDNNLNQTAVMCKESEFEMIDFISKCYTERVPGLLPIKMYLQYIDGYYTLGDDVEIMYTWNKKAYERHLLNASTTPKSKTKSKPTVVNEKEKAQNNDSKTIESSVTDLRDVEFFELDFYFDSSGNKIQKDKLHKDDVVYIHNEPGELMIDENSLKIEIKDDNGDLIDSSRFASYEPDEHGAVIKDDLDPEIINSLADEAFERFGETLTKLDDNTVSDGKIPSMLDYVKDELYEVTSEDLASASETFSTSNNVEDVVEQIKEHKHENTEIRNISEIQKENNSPQVNTNKVIQSAFDVETDYVEHFPLQQKIDMDFEIVGKIDNDATSRNNTAKGVESKFDNKCKKKKITNQPSLFEFTPERRTDVNIGNTIIDEMEPEEEPKDLTPLYTKEKRI